MSELILPKLSIPLTVVLNHSSLLFNHFLLAQLTLTQVLTSFAYRSLSDTQSLRLFPHEVLHPYMAQLLIYVNIFQVIIFQPEIIHLILQLGKCFWL